MSNLNFKRCVRALQDKDPAVRKDAIQALAIMGNSQAVEPLINTLNDAAWDVRLYVVMALGVIADPQGVEPLAKALNDEDEGVRSAAADALGGLGRLAVEALISALSHEDYSVRRSAAEALGDIGDPRAIKALTLALRDSYWDVHKAAENALKKMPSEEKGADSTTQRHQPVGGAIGYYGLADWWFGSFTEAERSHIVNTYCPAGTPQENPLTTGNLTYTTQSLIGFLWGLATWFNRPDDRYLALRILEYAEEIMGSLDQLALEEGESSLARNERGTSIIDAHFVYLGLIKTHYKDRDNITGSLDKAIEACKKQIRIAPQAARAFRAEYKDTPIPSHTGFEQLAIIRDKQADYSTAIQLCEEAKAQGWAGDWDKRINRYRKKAEKR